MACAISAALLAAGCSGGGGKEERGSGDGAGELFLQPVAAQGPDPFTDSTATGTATPSPTVTRSPQPAPTGSSSPTAPGIRSVSGGTPGLYGGTHSLGSCDVDQQVRFLTSNRAKGRAFAQASGIAQGDIERFLRDLTPVVLRADTRVTNHGYRDGRATSFQSVLQAGTAVLVDERGLPRVRCACGNPLKPPVALKGAPRHNGAPWRGYRPTQVVVVTPAPRPITTITIVNITNNTWIERKVGDEDADQDRAVDPPVTPEPTDGDTGRPDTGAPDTDAPDTDEPDTGEPTTTEPDGTTTDCPTPSPVTVGPGESPTRTPSPVPPGCPSPSTVTPQEPSEDGVVPPPVPPEPQPPEPPVPPEPDNPDEPSEEGGPDGGVPPPPNPDLPEGPDDPSLSENPLDSGEGSFAS